MEIKRPQSKQPLPDHAKKVFEGIMFDVYQWEQEMYDGSTATFEKLMRPDTVLVFPVLDSGNILLTKQQQPGKQPFIGAAGGRVDPGEEILEAAKRELLEETGCEASEFILWKSLQPISKIEWAVYIFVAKGVKKVADLSLDPGEKIEVIEVSFDEFIDYVLSSNFSEQEIYTDIVEAMFDKDKKEQLQRLLSAKNDVSEDKS